MFLAEEEAFDIFPTGVNKVEEINKVAHRLVKSFFIIKPSYNMFLICNYCKVRIMQTLEKNHEL